MNRFDNFLLKGAEAIVFPVFIWNLYAAGRGTRIDGKSCGVDELTRIVNMLRAKKMLATGMPSQRRAQAGRAISCCEAWLQGRMYSEKAKTTDFCNYLKSMSDK
jgi:hypothetical protein